MFIDFILNKVSYVYSTFLVEWTNYMYNVIKQKYVRLWLCIYLHVTLLITFTFLKGQSSTVATIDNNNDKEEIFYQFCEG